MPQIVVFGAGKIAEVVKSYLIGDPNFSIAGFACDSTFIKGSDFHSLPLVSFEGVENVFPPSSFAMLVAIGYHDLNRLRAERCRQAQEKGYRLISWVSPRAHVSATCTAGATGHR